MRNFESFSDNDTLNYIGKNFSAAAATTTITTALERM
jgi:hypothetical protein